MKSERLFLILLGSTIVIVCAGVLVVASSKSRTAPASPDQVARQPLQIPTSRRQTWRLEAHEREMANKDFAMNKRLIGVQKQLKAEGVTQGVELAAIRKVLSEPGLDITYDPIALYRRVAKLPDKEAVSAFFDENLRDPKVGSGLKAHALSLLATMNTPKAQEAIAEHFKRLHVKDLADDRRLQQQMRSVIMAASLMAMKSQDDSAMNTSDWILRSIVTSPIQEMPPELRVDALDMLGTIKTDAARELMRELAAGRMKLKGLEDAATVRKVRKLAILSLGKIADPRSLDILFDLEENQLDLKLRLDAVESLGAAGSKRMGVHEIVPINELKRNPPSDEVQSKVIDRLQQILERPEENPRVLNMAMRMLGKIDTQRSTQALAALLRVEGDSPMGQTISVILDVRLGADRQGGGPTDNKKNGFPDSTEENGG